MKAPLLVVAFAEGSRYRKPVPDITLLLESLHRGEPDADGALLTQVYAELRQLARAKMAREQPGHTLQPTALVHEAWLRLDCGGATGEQRFANRAHFFGAAAEAMRRILIERARRKLAARHGAGAEHVDVDDFEIPIAPGKEEEILAVHDALEALAAHDARKAEVVKLHYFAGFTLAHAADTLGIAEPTARRDWAYARAWLRREIGRA
jgi:RNA polymerase sigma factor (TIGR02999 family)